MMLLTVDNLAHRYHCLPSEVLERATTLDLTVIDLISKWAKYQHEQMERQQANKLAPKAPHLTKEQMQAMIDRVKKRSDNEH